MLLELMILKKISKLHLIHFILVFVSFFVYTHGIEFDDHGYYNIIYFFIITISVLILLLILGILISVKRKKIHLLFFLFLLILLNLLRNFLYDLNNCKDWSKGLNNTSIDNDKKKYGCNIKIPNSCTYKIGKYFFDRNKISSDNCNKVGIYSREKLLMISKSPYINQNTSHIGYPLVNRNEKLFLDNENFFTSLKKYSFDNLVDMNNFTLLNTNIIDKPEISVDFSKTKIGKMKINVNFNKTLSNERKKKEKFAKPYSNNIMIIYLDSVSRAYSMRQLKKTLSFFEKFIPYKGYHHSKFPNDNYHSFQFFKYHSFKHYTVGNYPIIFYGNHRNKRNKHITLTLKKMGFVIGYSADNCFIDFTRTFHDFSFDDIYDHQYLICDPNKLLPSSKLNCFYGKLHVESMFEYINQFWEKYKVNRKFSMLLTNFAHEGSLEMLKYIDNIIYHNLNKLFNDNLLKDTSIFLLSDHGVALPSIYYLNDFFQFEKNLPMFYLIVNDRKNVSYEMQYKYLYQNQQTFITAFDIYNTIINIIYGDKYNTENISSIYGKSLFSNIDPKHRSPKIYEPMDKYACI